LRGKFIVFEGIDGSGKTTYAKRLKEYLSKGSEEAHFTFEPTKYVIGSLIRKVINKEIELNEQSIAALFAADRIDHVQNHEYGMLQYLNNGHHVVCDRYYISSYAYHVPHVSLPWVVEANSIAAGMLKADITFYIDISVETSLQRISQNRQQFDLFESKDRITLVRENYYKAIDYVGDSENIIMIDGEKSMEEVYQDIVAKVDQVIVPYQ
jgi:dTMP kinase